MSSALVIVHLSSLDMYADMYGVDTAQDLVDRLVDAVLDHAGPVYIIDQRWPYSEKISDPRLDFVNRVQLARDINWLHFEDDNVVWELFLEHFGNHLKRDKVRTVVLGGVWYSPEGAGCVSDAQEYLSQSFTVRVNPRLVACVPTQ